MLPPGGDRRTIVLLACALLFLINATTAHPQVFDLQGNCAPMAELNGPWRFHTGDDADGRLGWATSAFDDSSWPLLRSDLNWGAQGYQNHSGFGWYRFQLLLPPRPCSYALYFPEFDTSYQVFADGRLIGSFGGLPPLQRVDNPISQLFILPPAQSRRPIQIAIRAWAWQSGAGGPTSAPRVGEIHALRSWASLEEKFRFWSWASAFLVATGWLIAGLAALALYSLRRSEQEYLWFALYALAWAARWAELIAEFGHFVGAWLFPMWMLSSALYAAAQFGLLFFVWRLLGARRDRLFQCAVVSVFATLALDEAGNLALAFTSGSVPAVALALWNTAVTVPMVPFWMCILIRLSGAARRSIADARLLFFPIGLSALTWIIIGFMAPLELLGVKQVEPYIIRFHALSQWPIPFGMANVADWFIQLSLIGILILRFARSRSDEQRMAGELEAARVVQQVLIPEEIPTIPGLELECVYKPAGQVGGDFFQIIPVHAPAVGRIALPQASQFASPEGAGAFRPLNAAADRGGFRPGHSDSPPASALIVIGDVSGKGMPAAMAVSLLVGTVRTLAHYTQNPGEIVTAMNQRMLGRSKNGFTTCLVLRLDPDGAATVANAGHLAPYTGSQEIPVESGLPLGLAADAEYPESTFRLEPSAQLTLLTDGVVEARAKTGELFGFERTAAISNHSAAQIAKAAELFGQEDDITVLKIRRQAIPVLP